MIGEAKPAGWGKADIFKNGQMLFKDYAAHFLVKERSRDPNTREVHYPMELTFRVGKPTRPGWKSIYG